ncbi:MAG: phytanoyl-CoA dioxygenase family protein [Gammaproteobacteria bacterium]|nr:phytanoyl-CoA dioxygenase family protein [Gammaproteobacteria bacterium]
MNINNSTATQQQVEQFQRDGFVVIENALSEFQLSAIKADLAKWVEESKQHTQPFGQIQDGRPRFDIEPNTHTSDSPALRRITSPAEISDACLDVVKNNSILDLVTQFFGPNIKHWGNKINLKLPSSGTEVKFHQDFPFEPHSNEDIVTVLFFLDDVTLENGPLEVVPGTHKGQLHTLWHNGVFTGAVSDDVELQHKSRAVNCYGKAGSACLMHSKLLHGSRANNSDLARCLYIVSYSAEDAVSLVPNPLPSKLDGMIVRGELTGTARCTSYNVELPEYPKEVSFFGQQDKAKNM